MTKRTKALSSATSLTGTPSTPSPYNEISLNDNFWLPLSKEQIAKDAEEWARQFGLMSPELAELLGVRWALREDTLKSVH
jgi:hypothetical protein